MTRIVAAISRLSRLLAIGFAVLALPAWAQDLPVVMGERVFSKEMKALASPYLLTTEEEMPAHALRLVQPSARELRSLQPRGTFTKRVDIGFGRDVAELAEEPAAKALAWQVVGASRIAKLRVQSPGAQALRVGIRIGSTRQPWELRVAGNADETKALGPLRLGGPLGKTEIHWTPLTEGDAQVIELVSPASLPAPAVEVVSVSHLVASPKDRFRKRTADIGSSEPCNIDIACIIEPDAGLPGRGERHGAAARHAPGRRIRPVQRHDPQRHHAGHADPVPLHREPLHGGRQRRPTTR